MVYLQLQFQNLWGIKKGVWLDKRTRDLDLNPFFFFYVENTIFIYTIYFTGIVQDSDEDYWEDKDPLRYLISAWFFQKANTRMEIYVQEIYGKMTN